MKFFEKEEDMPFGEIEHEDYNDGTVHHLFCDGSRRHVLHWDSQGEHCSCEKCEINKK